MTRSCESKGGVFDKNTYKCISKNIEIDKESESEISSLIDDIKLMETLPRDSSINSIIEKTRLLENEFIDKYVKPCKQGQIKSLNGRCVPKDGKAGLESLGFMTRSCESKGGVFDNNTYKCLPKQMDKRGSPAPSTTSTMTIEFDPCPSGQVRTLDKRCVSENIEEGRNTIKELKKLCSNMGEGYVFNETTYKCEKVIPKNVSKYTVWSPSESEYSSPSPSPLEERPVLRSPLEERPVLPSPLRSPFSSISSSETVLMEEQLNLDNFRRNKDNFVALVISQYLDKYEYNKPKTDITCINNLSVTTKYTFNSNEINVAYDLETMKNLRMLIYNVQKELERRFPENEVIKQLPRTIEFLELKNNMMINLDDPYDLVNIKQVKFVNFYVFEGIKNKIGVPKGAQLLLSNVIMRDPATDNQEDGYYLLL